MYYYSFAVGTSVLWLCENVYIACDVIEENCKGQKKKKFLSYKHEMYFQQFVCLPTEQTLWSKQGLRQFESCCNIHAFISTKNKSFKIISLKSCINQATFSLAGLDHYIFSWLGKETMKVLAHTGLFLLHWSWCSTPRSVDTNKILKLEKCS